MASATSSMCLEGNVATAPPTAATRRPERFGSPPAGVPLVTRRSCWIRGGVQFRRDLSHQRSFPCAVRPENRKNLAFINVNDQYPIRDRAIRVALEEARTEMAVFFCRSFIEAP